MVYPAMATFAKNAKIFDVIIFPVMVNMVNIQFLVFLSAKIALFREVTKSYFAVFCHVFIPSCFLAITTVKRAVLFFKVFCSRFWKSKFFSTNFTSTSHREHFAYSFCRTFCRATRCLISFNSFRCAEKFSSTYRTVQANFFSLKSVLTVHRTKEVFRLFCFPKGCFKLFRAMTTFNFHIQHGKPCEVLWAT